MNHLRLWLKDPDFWRPVAQGVISAFIVGAAAVVIAAAFGYISRVVLAQAIVVAVVLYLIVWLIGLRLTNFVIAKYGDRKLMTNRHGRAVLLNENPILLKLFFMGIGSTILVVLATGLGNIVDSR